ncbi:Lysozyme [Araneus ventricosus]|uniref:lysozyme n=1 Tax=Araneus ventricosus TaxID=182803 RepID=A0A4Y2IAC6_ARAVE|nr:Lysozyme [Araneus ventricosus]
MWKSSVVLFVLSSLLLEPVAGIVVNPCAVADVFVSKLGVTKQNAAKWVCLAKFASGFNTKALGPTDKNGNDYFGLFQINDNYCKKGTKKSCGVSCTELVSDDILPSATCALNIYNKEGGFSNWPAWKNNCQNLDPNRFINNCNIKPK